jgi:hypothetical protein
MQYEQERSQQVVLNECCSGANYVVRTVITLFVHIFLGVSSLFDDLTYVPKISLSYVIEGGIKFWTKHQHERDSGNVFDSLI